LPEPIALAYFAAASATKEKKFYNIETGRLKRSNDKPEEFPKISNFE
jgi:hypothetical protein